MKITHHFGGGVYQKQTDFDAGEELTMHEHVHGHQSTLCKGWAEVTIDGQTEQHRGPAFFLVEAGRPHTVKALTAATWLCTHATDETDPDKIDETLVE